MQRSRQITTGRVLNMAKGSDLMSVIIIECRPHGRQQVNICGQVAGRITKPASRSTRGTRPYTTGDRFTGSGPNRTRKRGRSEFNNKMELIMEFKIHCNYPFKEVKVQDGGVVIDLGLHNDGECRNLAKSLLQAASRLLYNTDDAMSDNIDELVAEM